MQEEREDIIRQAHSPIGLNTDWLLANGWTRNGRIYTKGDDVIKFDGTNWILNGEQL